MLHELRQRAPLDEHPRARAAVLPGVAEDGAREPVRGVAQVGVGEHDRRRLAAELERHLLDVARGSLPDVTPDGRRARERDLAHAGSARPTLSPVPTSTVSSPSCRPAS